MKYLILCFTLFTVACSQSVDTPEPSFSLVNSTCNMPPTSLEVGPSFVVIEQKGIRFYATTVVENDLNSNYDLTIKQKVYGFHLAEPVWEETYSVSPSGNDLLLQSASCTNTFRKN